MSQNKRIEVLLKQTGKVSRNQCLSMFPAITRLSARIADLEEMGYVFEAEQSGGDYVYKVIRYPQAKQLALVV